MLVEVLVEASHPSNVKSVLSNWEKHLARLKNVITVWSCNGAFTRDA